MSTAAKGAIGIALLVLSLLIIIVLAGLTPIFLSNLALFFYKTLNSFLTYLYFALLEEPIFNKQAASPLISAGIHIFI
jgi:hypothetical protein